MTRVFNQASVLVLTIMSLPIALYAFYGGLGAEVPSTVVQRLHQFPVFGALHMLGGGLALLVGGLQFSSRLRAARPNLHRWLGRLYLLGILIGGVSAIAAAPGATGGVVAACGFGLLGILWLYSGAQAYRAIRAGDIATHRAWMMRNFAMTFAAVTLRIYLGLMTGPMGLTFEEAYPAVAWISWVPNVLPRTGCSGPFRPVVRERKTRPPPRPPNPPWKRRRP